MSGPDKEKAPPVVASEASNQLTSPGSLTEQASVSKDLPIDEGCDAPNTAEPGLPGGILAEPQILWRTDYPSGISVVRLPTYGPSSGYFHELAIFWHGSRKERVISVLRKLWARGLLPFMVLLVAVRPGQIEIGFDLPNPEEIARYQAEFNKLAWAFPWKLVAVELPASSVQLAGDSGLGLRHIDDAPAGGAP